MFDLEKELERSWARCFKKDGGVQLKFESPSMNGVADRINFLDTWCFFIEFKRHDGRAAHIQIHFANMMRRQGFKVYLIDTTRRLDDLLYAYRAQRMTGYWPPYIPERLELLHVV